MKLGAWMILLTVFALFLSFMGLNLPVINPIVSSVGVNINETDGQVISADLEQASIWKKLFTEEAFSLGGIEFTGGILVLLLGAGAVVIGLFAKGYDPSLVVLPFIVLVAGIYISIFWGVIAYAKNLGWITNIITLILVAMGVGFIYSCVEFFRSG